MMEAIGYGCQYTALNTSNYYLPHIRNRGYMVCVHKKSFADGAKIKQELGEWGEIVKQFARPASVPVDCMLMTNDHPYLHLAAAQDISQVPRKTTEAVKSKQAYDQYRKLFDLGNERPITQCRSDGFYRLPEYWVGQRQGLTDRVCDVIDIAHLRNLRRGFDDRFYW
jgi:site-specific DNA-cytosine methylase